MSTDIAIRVENLGKRYPALMRGAGRIGQREPYKALRDMPPPTSAAEARHCSRLAKEHVTVFMMAGGKVGNERN